MYSNGKGGENNLQTLNKIDLVLVQVVEHGVMKCQLYKTVWVLLLPTRTTAKMHMQHLHQIRSFFEGNSK